jgi:dynactin complex subunit
MNSLGISLNLLNDHEEKTVNEKNLLAYIEEIQTKFIDQIEKKNLQNETLILENQILKNKVKESNEEVINYYNQLSNMQECLKIQVETNEKLLTLVKENENSFSSRILNYFN